MAADVKTKSAHANANGKAKSTSLRCRRRRLLLLFAVLRSIEQLKAIVFCSRWPLPLVAQKFCSSGMFL